MNMTWRPAWPHSVAGVAEPKTLPRKTVRSSKLPAMPTGHAQTRRRMPPKALARPKMLPSTSRRIRTDPPTGICASKSHRKKSMRVSFLPSRTAMAPGVYDSTIMRRHLGAAVTAVRASLIQTLTVGTGISPIQPFAGILSEERRWRAGRGLSPPVRTYTDPGARMCVVILTQLPGQLGLFPGYAHYGLSHLCGSSLPGPSAVSAAAGRAEPVDGVRRVRGAVDGRAGDEDVRSRLCGPHDRLLGDAAVDLQRHLHAGAVDGRAGPSGSSAASGPGTPGRRTLARPS